MAEHIQRALVAAGREIARGASTGLVLAGISRCPDCSPVVHCGTSAACPPCPNCVCGEGVSKAQTLPIPANFPFWIFLALVLAFISGIFVGRLTSVSTSPPRRKLAVKALDDVASWEAGARPLPWVPQRVARQDLARPSP